MLDVDECKARLDWFLENKGQVVLHCECVRCLDSSRIRTVLGAMFAMSDWGRIERTGLRMKEDAC